MQNVSRFEANLLRLLYYFLGHEPAERALPLVEQRSPVPSCLSRGAIRLAKDALARGCTFLLAQRGGWRNERHLRGDRVVEGRLWDRTPPSQLGLAFSRQTLEFLIWITAARPGDQTPEWGPDHAVLTVGDLLLLFLAHQGLRETPDSLGAPDLRRRQPFDRHALCWLAYPEDWGEVHASVSPEFAPWTTGVGAAVLEALQPALTERLVATESAKEQVRSPQVMRNTGLAQERVLSAFLTALEKAGRFDLARFLLRGGAVLLGRQAEGAQWIGGLQIAGLRLSDRAATYQAALAYLRQLDRLQTWARRSRTIGYFDDGYEAAKLYLADWELYQGDFLIERAHDIVRQVDPLRQGLPSS
jgi:hypothetical protein